MGAHEEHLLLHLSLLQTRCDSSSSCCCCYSCSVVAVQVQCSHVPTRHSFCSPIFCRRRHFLALSCQVSSASVRLVSPCVASCARVVWLSSPHVVLDDRRVSFALLRVSVSVRLSCAVRPANSYAIRQSWISWRETAGGFGFASPRLSLVRCYSLGTNLLLRCAHKCDHRSPAQDQP